MIVHTAGAEPYRCATAMIHPPFHSQTPTFPLIHSIEAENIEPKKKSYQCPRSTFLWLLKCLGLCLLGIFLLGFIGSSMTPLIKWAIYHNDPTSFLAKSFGSRFHLPLCVLYGLALGLIPLHRIVEVFQSSWGIIAARTHPRIQDELDWKRPILWAWIPVGSLFLFRFLLWQPFDHSVLTSASSGRFDYFFSPPNFATLTPAWMFDRFVLTGPTLFLLAYPIGVWIRHQLPSLSDPDPSATESAPLIHSIEAENIEPNQAGAASPWQQPHHPSPSSNPSSPPPKPAPSSPPEPSISNLSEPSSASSSEPSPST